ncbi:NAD synthetase [Nonlabens ulvanivorans]|nr:NAD synthetase [Nonlabens ulvanivorans]
MNEISNGKTASDFTGRKLEVFNLYSDLNKKNQHKMNPIPVCIIPKNLSL